MSMMEGQRNKRGMQSPSLFLLNKKAESRKPLLVHSQTFRFLAFVLLGLFAATACIIVCGRACVCGRRARKHFHQQKRHTIRILHYVPHPSISVSFPPQLKLFHLSFSHQQSTNSLSCQSKPTFMQPIINDTIHLARSLSPLISPLSFPSSWSRRAPESQTTIHCRSQSPRAYIRRPSLATNLTLVLPARDLDV